MSRRSSTFAVAGAVLVALIAVAALLSVPYVVYSPGPLEDTLGEWEGEPVIQVDGAETFPTEGILFKDITTLLKDGPAFRAVVDMLAGKYRGEQIDVVWKARSNVAPSCASRSMCGVFMYGWPPAPNSS